MGKEKKLFASVLKMRDNDLVFYFKLCTFRLDGLKEA